MELKTDRYFIVAYSTKVKSLAGDGQYVGSMALSCNSYPPLTEIQNGVKTSLGEQGIEVVGEVATLNIMELSEQDYTDYLGGHTL